MKFSELAQNIKPSPTLAITALANRLVSEGKDIVKLTAGEPDFPPPGHVIEAGIQAFRDGKTKYTAASGIPELKQAICDKLSRDNCLDYTPADVIASCGAKQAIFHCVQAIVSPGDEVIIPAPYWVSYPDMCELFGARKRLLPTTLDSGFRLSAEALAEAINERTRLLILNSPSNPTGSVYRRADLEAIAETLLKHPDVWIISDDIYEKIYWADEPFANIVQVCPELQSRCCIINGVSKSYAMTGLRLGYAAGPAGLIKLMSNIQSQSTSNPCSVSQYAALSALTGDQQEIHDNVGRYREHHDLMIGELNKIPGLRTLAGEGAFYLLPDCSGLIERLDGIDNDIDLCALLLERAGLAVVSGSSFGAPGHIRLSYATSKENIVEGVRRLASC